MMSSKVVHGRHAPAVAWAPAIYAMFASTLPIFSVGYRNIFTILVLAQNSFIRRAHRRGGARPSSMAG